MKTKVFVRILTLLLLLATLTSLVGCSAARTVRASSNADDVVATAGEIEILYDEYYYVAMTRLAHLKEQYGEDALSDPQVLAEFRSFVQDNLLTQSHALLALGLSYGIDIEEGQVDENVQAHMEGILNNTFAGDRDAYIESLYDSYLTDRYIRTFVAVENYLSVEIIKKMLENGELSDADDVALTFLRGDDFIRVRQVFIESAYVKGGAEAAKLKAQALRDKVAAAATDAERNLAMLDVMSESRDFTDNGDGIYFARGEMEKNYEDAAFALPLYGVSEVIEVEGGYSFMMRLPKEDAYLVSNLEALKGKTYYITLNAKLDAWLAANPLQMTSFGASLDPADLDPIEPDGGEGIFLLILLLLGVVLLVATVWIVRVLVLRHRVKSGKPLTKKPQRKAAKDKKTKA